MDLTTTTYNEIKRNAELTKAFLKLIKTHFSEFNGTSCEKVLLTYFNKIKARQMAKSDEKKQTNEFVLADNRVLTFKGMSYTNKNLTDDIAMQFINQNFKRISAFSKHPKNYKKRVAEHISDLLEAEEKNDLEAIALEEFGVDLDKRHSVAELKSQIAELRAKKKDTPEQKGNSENADTSDEETK